MPLATDPPVEYAGGGAEGGPGGAGGIPGGPPIWSGGGGREPIPAMAARALPTLGFGFFEEPNFFFIREIP